MLEQNATIMDMGLLSQYSYNAFGIFPILKGQSVSQFTDDGTTFILNSPYTIIDYVSTATDMQALLLKKNGTDEYVIAFRGTESDSWFDIGTDIMIGLSNYNLQFNDAKAFVQNMMTTHNISADSLTLTGHSLGGILTQSVGAVLGIKGYAFNPYGTERLLTMWPNYSGSLPGALISVGIYQVLNAFGLDSSYADFARENILNVSYNDTGTINGDILSNFATALSSGHLGTYLPLLGDNVGVGAGHSMSVLNAAIKRYNELLAKFTEETAYNDLSMAYLIGGKDGFNSASQAFDALMIDSVPDGSLTLELLGYPNSTGDLVPLTPYNIETRARTDIAYRYALVNLNPFAVLGADYSSFNQNGELDLYDPATGQGLTNMYLADRAEMLANLIHGNINDTTLIDGNVQYLDKQEGVSLKVISAAKTVAFNGDAGGILEGVRTNAGNRLYGGSGNDVQEWLLAA